MRPPASKYVNKFASVMHLKIFENKKKVEYTLVCLINVMHALFNFGPTSTGTILFGPARLLIFGHFYSLYEMKFYTFFKAAAYFFRIYFDPFCLTIFLLENKQKK